VKAPITVAQGATVEISSAYAGAVRFAADTGTLELAQSSRFSGTVAGMSGNDSIDFADIGAAAELFRRCFRRHAPRDGRHCERLIHEGDHA